MFTRMGLKQEDWTLIPNAPLQPRGRYLFAVVRKPVNSHFETQRRRGHRVPLCFQFFFSVRTLGITVKRLNVSSGPLMGPTR